MKDEIKKYNLENSLVRNITIPKSEFGAIYTPLKKYSRDYQEDRESGESNKENEKQDSSGLGIGLAGAGAFLVYTIAIAEKWPIIYDISKAIYEFINKLNLF